MHARSSSRLLLGEDRRMLGSVGLALPSTSGGGNGGAGKGPVIGGQTSLGASPPPLPPAHAAKGPGAGNLSGLLLVMAIFAAIATAVFLRLQKMQKKSSVHSKAQKIADQLKAAALKPNKHSGSKGGPRFTALQQADEDEPDDQGLDAGHSPASPRSKKSKKKKANAGRRGR